MSHMSEICTLRSSWGQTWRVLTGLRKASRPPPREYEVQAWCEPHGQRRCTSRAHDQYSFWQCAESRQYAGRRSSWVGRSQMDERICRQSHVKNSKSVHCADLWTLDFGHWTFDSG